ncbi:hypothetical protein GCM10023195_59040 [Actinoallomurus liliacearum]|uniref:3,4-dihydroxy-2-butanone-4-phosphate synthase n=1 Tax=Actinoallomurus liliacearum TaxID=1080073 RepID=A0ABP8TSG1_9ACTN
MFTGHVREVGTVVAADQAHIVVSAPEVAAAAPGSICLNGVGLSVVRSGHEPDLLEAGLSAETRRRSTLDRLEIGPIPGPGDRHGTRPHVPVDLAAGTGTGVSAAERAATVRRLAHPRSRPDDFLRPGHVFPPAARPGGLSERAGHTEATVAMCVATGLPPVGVCREVMNSDGTMATAADLELAALRWGLPPLDVDDLRRHL